MSRAARITVVSLAITAAAMALLAVPATADDAHQACAGTVTCTGNVGDVHDVTTGPVAPILSVIG